MSKSSYLRFSTKYRSQSNTVHPDVSIDDVKRSRSDSLE